MHMHDVLRSDRPYRYPEGQRRHFFIFEFSREFFTQRKAKQTVRRRQHCCISYLISHFRIVDGHHPVQLQC